MRDLIFSLLFFAITFANLEGGDTSRMLLDLDVIKSVFETKYAPYEWKKNYLGWNLEDEIQLAKIKILSLNSLTVKDYQRILHTFFVSIRDHHVHDYYYSTEKSLLPFEIKSANHRYFFTDLDQKALDKMVLKETYKGEKLPQIGDELILFDSRPVDDVIQEIKSHELADLTSRTSQMLAEGILTKRIGAWGHLTPQGSILIQFKTADESLTEATIEWVHTPEKIHHHSYTSAMATFGKLEKAIEDKEQPSLLPLDQMMNILADVLNKDYSALLKGQFGTDEKSSEEDDDASSNEEESESSSAENVDSEEESEDEDDESPITPVPPRAVKRNQIIFGKKLWEEPKPSPFHAYIYQLPGTSKKIGYIRISTYSVNNNKNTINKGKNPEDAMENLLHLAHSLHVLQSKTDALLIDQVDNPGGSL
ncbi:MAG: protease-like activity factor CPAF, partial [Parachlamydiaceae bacterium]